MIDFAEHRTMFLIRWWITTWSLILVNGDLNESRFATEIQTEIVTQTLFTSCDPVFDKDCIGPINRPSEYSKNAAMGLTVGSDPGTTGKGSLDAGDTPYVSSSDSPLVSPVTTRTIEQDAVNIATGGNFDQNETTVALLNGTMSTHERWTKDPRSFSCPRCTGGK